ncbi:MAG: hypothetical protein OXE50_15100 [Chloroflexi bacterium]|nr:hypothetical protein [Chloroflexota bacterium]
MLDPLARFTPKRWKKAKRILLGKDDERVSLTAAAQAAGISLAEIKGWIGRSEEKRPGDDPLIHEIAEVYHESDAHQAGRLEDIAWKRGVVGELEPLVHQGKLTGDNRRKYDNKLLEKMLAVRDDRYRPSKDGTTILKLDAGEIFERLLAAQRLAIAREKKGEIIDHDKAFADERDHGFLSAPMPQPPPQDDIEELLDPDYL